MKSDDKATKKLGRFIAFNETNSIINTGLQGLYSDYVMLRLRVARTMALAAFAKQRNQR